MNIPKLSLLATRTTTKNDAPLLLVLSPPSPFVLALFFFFFFFPFFFHFGQAGTVGLRLSCTAVQQARCGATTDNRLLRGMTILKPLVSCFFCITVATSLLLARAAATAISSSIPGVVEMARDVQTLRQLAKNHGKFFGSCENINVLNNGSAYPEYQNIINTQFSLVTAENSCKFTETEYTENSFQFTDCDTIFSHATNANQVMRGHNLVWGKLNPPWLTQSNFSREQLTNVMKTHIDTVVKHYNGKTFCWDVVNEAVTDYMNESMFKSNDWYP